MLEWETQEEEDAGINADKAYENKRDSAYIRYNYVWATFGKVRKYIENIIEQIRPFRISILYDKKGGIQK